MKALQWDNQRLRVNDIAVPRRNTGEALVRVSLGGICNTDLEILRGYHRFTGTLGHEFLGRVEDADDPGLLRKRVVSDINCACGDCVMCIQGKPHHCLRRRTLGINRQNGAFAEYLIAPQHNLVLLPDGVSDETAVFAEPVAAALRILQQVDCAGLDAVAVLGDGKLGLLIAMTLSASGLRVSLVGHHPERAALLEDYDVCCYDRPPPRTFPLVVEATGNPRGFADAVALTAATGTLVLKSTYADGFHFNPAPLVVNEITLLGSRCGPMDKAVELLAQGRIDPRPLIEARYPLARGVEAVEHAQRKGVLKVLIAGE